jgi:hypothetical protein
MDIVILIMFIILLLVIFTLCVVNTNTFKYYFPEQTLKEGLTTKISAPDEIAVHLLYIHNALEGLDIKHWLMLSTLLGAVRDKNIVVNDDYFYLGANINDVNTIIDMNKYVAGDGYSFYKPMGKVWDYLTTLKETNFWTLSVRVQYEGKDVGDIFIYQSFDDDMLRRFDLFNGVYFWPIFSFPKWYVDELTSVTINDKSYPVPRKSSVLLSYWYGKNWNKFDKDHVNINDHYGGKIDATKFILYNLSYYLDKTYSITVHPYLNDTVAYIYPSDQKTWITVNDTPNQNKV